MDRLLLVMCALAVFVSAPAQAATRTVCFNMDFKEIRDDLGVNSPENGDDGALRGRHNIGVFTPAVGHLYELWDKDEGSISNEWPISDGRRSSATRQVMLPWASRRQRGRRYRRDLCMQWA